MGENSSFINFKLFLKSLTSLHCHTLCYIMQKEFSRIHYEKGSKNWKNTSDYTNKLVTIRRLENTGLYNIRLRGAGTV